MAASPAIEQDKVPKDFKETWKQPEGFIGFLATIDNIPIAVRYMATSFAFFIIGGILALVMRVQLSRPENRVLDPATYNQLFTMHGTTMIFLFVVPFLEAFANYLIPLLNGTRDLPFPRLTALGMATAMLAAAKKPIPIGESPVVYMWCTQSPKLRNPVATSASTISV